MTDTIREIIIQDFVARLAVITVVNGYNTNIGSTVLRARKKVDVDELPCSVVIPGIEKVAEHNGGYDKFIMPMRLEGLLEIVKTGSPAEWDDPSVVSEKILGDLKKCILTPENLLTSPVSGWSRSPDYISGIVYTEGGPSDGGEDETTAGSFAMFDVAYWTKRNDPYSQ
jgi:hypothetical protein